MRFGSGVVYGRSLMPVLAWLFCSVLFVSCGKSNSFTLTGNVSFDWVPALDIGEGGPKLGYAAKVSKPARRVVVEATAGGNPVAQTATDELGNYSLSVPGGNTVNVRVVAQMAAGGYVPDGLGVEHCNGASWDIRVVDNTNNQAQYMIVGGNTYGDSATGLNFHAGLGFSNGYTDRTAAPFSLLNTVLTEMELFCSAAPAMHFPLLFINWSPDNIPANGSIWAGQIGTSFFTTISGISSLFILGDENVDTDEYDDHVVAHETGHYMEHSLFRADSIGGSHSMGDTLDPTVAFSEGWGNSVSGMVWNDSIYVDTSGLFQSNGFTLDVSQTPAGDDQGVYSETSVQNLLYSLYVNHGGFSRLYNILTNYQRTTPALTTAQSFVAYYSDVYGATADSLNTLWSTNLNTPVASFTCTSGCGILTSGADPFDLDNDIGTFYAAAGGGPRKYPQSTGSTFGSEFWRLYRTIASGTTTGNGHEVTNFGSYGSSGNKFGVTRWYVYQAPATRSEMITVTGASPSGCSSDVLDMFVYQSGTIVGCDSSPDFSTGCANIGSATPGCPAVRISAVAGVTYIIQLQGFNTQLTGWNMTVSP